MKTILMTLVILAGSFAHAELGGNCKRLISEAATGYKQTMEIIKSGALTEAEALSLQNGWGSAAQSSALTCVGLLQISMERSFRGRMGLISDNEVERKSTQVYEEAMAYYNSLISK